MSAEEIDRAWENFYDGGKVLMPLDRYPFSERFGWIQDRFGLSWQLMLTNPESHPRPAILPALMFVGDNCGKAEEAIDFYLSVFKDAKWGSVLRYVPGDALVVRESPARLAVRAGEQAYSVDREHEERRRHRELVSPPASFLLDWDALEADLLGHGGFDFELERRTAPLGEVLRGLELPAGAPLPAAVEAIVRGDDVQADEALAEDVQADDAPGAGEGEAPPTGAAGRRPP